MPHFLDNRLTDGGEVVSPMRRRPFTPRKIPGTHFCWRLSRPKGHGAAGRARHLSPSESDETSPHYFILHLRLNVPCGLFPSSFTTQILHISISRRSHACYMPRPSHSLYFNTLLKMVTNRNY
jgi:hypothetical protein